MECNGSVDKFSIIIKKQIKMLIDEIEPFPYTRSSSLDNRRFLKDTFKKDKTDGDLTEPENIVNIDKMKELY